jgi:outer membrane protein assembly factor BamB
VPATAARPGLAPPQARGIDEASKWSLPWERSDEKRLAPGEQVLPIDGLDEGYLVTAKNGKLTFHPHDVAHKGWTTLLGFRPTTGWSGGERLLLAGSDGLAALNTRDQKPLWSIHRSGCSGFQLVSGRVFFLENNERLFAVDATSGDTLWTKWAIGARLHQLPPLGHFHPQITPLGTALLVQPTPGRLWLLDGATGKILHEETHRFEPWPRSPAVLDENTTAVVIDPRTVALIDASGKTIWKYVNDDATTFTGVAPQLVVARENILLLTANNFGYTLQRLNRATGKAIWLKAPLLAAKIPLDATGWSLDKNAVYYVLEHVLTARSLEDGSILWRYSLTEENRSWRTRRLGDAVLAYPAETGARQMQFRWQMFSVQWELNHSREVGVGRGLPVICCDASSGRVRQRLHLLAGPPRVLTRLGFLSRVAGPPLQDAAPQLLLTRTDVLIALDSTVWRFTPTQSRDR